MLADSSPAQNPTVGISSVGISYTAGGLSLLERMPKWLICVPIVVQWLWLSVRYGGATLPCVANPHITAGGLVGEGKLEYFGAMGPVARAATARHTSIQKAQTLSRIDLDEVMLRAGLTFPIIAKPDLGLAGYGVCKLDTCDALLDYMQNFPDGEVLVLQAYLPEEHEAGIFYIREPLTGRGRIIGLALRYYPRVRGDGVSTLAELIAADPRSARGMKSSAHTCMLDLSAVPAKGDTVRLATIGSTRVGGLYRDGARLITDRLTDAIDAIARDMPDFHFGRFDVRFKSAQELSDGTGFTIMEVNGAGSEAIQAWDPDIGLIKGLGMIFEKQRLLFAIGAANRRLGFHPIGLLTLMRLNQRQNRLIDSYPASN